MPEGGVFQHVRGDKLSGLLSLCLSFFNSSCTQRVSEKELPHSESAKTHPLFQDSTKVTQ